MDTRINKLMLCIAAATAAGTASAGILPPGFAGGVAIDHEVVISGATAPDFGLHNLIGQICLPGTATVFTDRCNAGTTSSTDCTGGATPGGRAPGSSYTATFCTVDGSANSVPGLSGTKNVMFRKRSAGGSFWGTTPVAFAQTNNLQMVISPANCALTPNNTYKCSNTNTFTGVPAIADMGTSDVPPGDFIPPNVGAGNAPCGTDCTGKLNAQSIMALGFGVPVTSALYVRLQLAQGLNPDSNGDGTNDVLQTTAVFNTPALKAGFEANMPSLSKTQIAALMKGGIGNWNKVFFNGLPLTDVSFGPAVADSRVFVCRRVNGSGTQATTNANLLNVPCSAQAELPAIDNSSCLSVTGVAATSPVACATATWANPVLPNVATTPVIHEASGSGDVEACMASIQAAGKLGIGVNSLDRPDNANWGFVKIEGVAPTIQNVTTGKYANYGAVSVQWRSADVNQDNNAANPLVPAPTGDKLLIMQRLRTDAADPATLHTLNFDYKFGRTGFLSITGAPIRPFNEVLPVMGLTRNGKTCNPDKPRSAVTGVGVDFGL